jgi:hypothetical protein
VDGDKRTAWVAIRLLFAYAGRRPNLTEDQAFDLVIRIATFCSEIEVKEIAARSTSLRRSGSKRSGLSCPGSLFRTLG